MRLNLNVESNSPLLPDWLKSAVGTTLLAILWAFNNPFGDELSID